MKTSMRICISVDLPEPYLDDLRPLSGWMSGSWDENSQVRVIAGRIVAEIPRALDEETKDSDEIANLVYTSLEGFELHMQADLLVIEKICEDVYLNTCWACGAVIDREHIVRETQYKLCYMHSMLDVEYSVAARDSWENEEEVPEEWRVALTQWRAEHPETEIAPSKDTLDARRGMF